MDLRQMRKNRRIGSVSHLIFECSAEEGVTAEVEMKSYDQQHVQRNRATYIYVE